MPLLITPMAEPVPAASPFTDPASHDAPIGWEVFHDNDDEITPVGNTLDGSDLTTLLAHLVEKTGDNRFSFVSEETRRSNIEINDLDASDFQSALMEVVVDETPDEDPNTDDHSLEEIRSAIEDIEEARATPDPA